jgi:hypothetical protein
VNGLWSTQTRQEMHQQHFTLFLTVTMCQCSDITEPNGTEDLVGCVSTSGMVGTVGWAGTTGCVMLVHK